MVIYIAPYSLADRSLNKDLGAMRKIEFFLKVIAQSEPEILLINTAHSHEQWRGRETQVCQLGNARVTEITLRTYPKRVVGKFLNLLEIPSVANEIARHGQPKLVWIYNSYVFECMLARELKKQYQVPLVMQFGDWPLARRRLHPKSWIDFLAWRHFLPKPDVCIADNFALSGREHKRSGCTIVMCPGVVSSDLLNICAQRSAFSGEGARPLKVGYFGGLTTEKGARIVLDLIRASGPGYEFHVSGTGELAPEFTALAKECDRLSYHGRVDDMTLFRLISECDVLLNLHESIEKMANGVFPFKVIEYIASGRLVLSTPVPDAGLPAVMSALEIVEPDLKSVTDALVVAKSTFERKRSNIESAVRDVRQSFGEEGMGHAVFSALA